MENYNTDRPASRKDPSDQQSTFSPNGNVYSGLPAKSTGGGIASELTVSFAFRAILRHWKVMLLVLIVGVTCGILYVQFARRIYKAESVLEMSVRRPRVTSNTAVFEDVESTRDSDAIFNTRFEKFKSPAMEQLATREFFKRYPEGKSVNNPAGIGKYAMAILIRDVEWSKDPDANIVRVSYQCPHPRFAANLVNVLSDCAGELMMDENRVLSDLAVKWLVSQVEEQRETLEDFETQLAEIREEVQLDAMQQRKEALGEALASVSKERETLISRLAERKTIYDFVSDLQEIDPDLELLPTGLPKEQQFNEMIAAWRAAYDEFQQISGRYTALHPEYRLAEEREARSRLRLEQFIESSAKAVQNEMDLLKRLIEQMDVRIDQMKQDASKLEQDLAAGMQQVQGLERKRDAADDAYQNMLRRMAEARASADDNMAFTKVIRSAEVPYVPIKPKKPVVMVFSIAMAGFLGLAIVVLLEFWTYTVGSVSDLRKINLNVLGIIPSQKKLDSRGELATIGLRDRFNPIVEMFAGINALLSSDKYKRHTQVLLFCSVMPSEGKTISSSNLAISSALNGMRTLLIDGDLRRPQLMNIFTVDEKHPSLLDWLLDGGQRLRFEELVARDVIDNLDIIPSRPLADTNPGELLGRGSMAQLLEWARKHYDRIIIDSPPVGAVGDAHVLANKADGVILVARIGKTRRRALNFALARFKELDVNVVGCIANDVPNSLTGMFGGSEGYTYGYGSRYGGYK